MASTTYSRDAWLLSLPASEGARIIGLLAKLDSRPELCSVKGPVLDKKARRFLDEATPEEIIEAFDPVERHCRAGTRQNVSAVITSSLNDQKHRQRRSRTSRVAQEVSAPASPRSPSSASEASSSINLARSPAVLPMNALGGSGLRKHASFALIILVCQLMKDNAIDVPASFGLLYDHTTLWLRRDKDMIALKQTEAWWGMALTELLQGLANQEECANLSLYVSGQKVWLQKDTVAIRLV